MHAHADHGLALTLYHASTTLCVYMSLCLKPRECGGHASQNTALFGCSLAQPLVVASRPKYTCRLLSHHTSLSILHHVLLELCEVDVPVAIPVEFPEHVLHLCQRQVLLGGLQNVLEGKPELRP
jgi:hypothetical protein